MDFDKVADNAKRANADQRAAAQAVLDSAFDAADRAILHEATRTTIELAKAPATDPT